MSMILDALKRSHEDQEDLLSSPSLHAGHGSVPRSFALPIVWVIALVLGVIVIVATTTWWFVRGAADTSEHLATAPEVKPVVTAEVPKVADDQHYPVHQEHPLPRATDPDVRALYVTPQANADDKPVNEPVTEVASPDTEAATVADQADEDAVDIAALVQRAQRELGESPLVPSPVPLLETLSQQQKDRIPTIMYTGHEWGGEQAPAVIINGQRLIEGGRDNGFEVQQILVDSVILTWGGMEFRLRALNSWINL